MAIRPDKPMLQEQLDELGAQIEQLRTVAGELEARIVVLESIVRLPFYRKGKTL